MKISAVSEKVIADFITPVSFYSLFRNESYSFLLESAEQGKTGRYSFVGFSPRKVYRLFADRVEIFVKEGDGYSFEKEIKTDDPLSLINEIQQKYEMSREGELPPFAGGLVGFVNYEIISTWENIKFKSEQDKMLGEFIFVDELAAFDHLHKTVDIIKLFINENDRKAAKERVKEIVEKVAAEKAILAEISLKGGGEISFKSNFTKEEFETKVSNIKREIVNGEIIQGVFSQRLETEVKGDPFNYYRILRVINPSPYMFYLKMDDFILCGSSPEVLVKVTDGRALVRPIAGTRPRSENETEQKKMEEELVNDEKEKAEHVMLVDLGRNDLSRVCLPGSVRTSNLMAVEKYSHVIHMVSDVTGAVRKDASCVDVFKSCFPAGTVSGAPKLRAMEIIAQQENLSRGPYAGSVGYFSFTGDMDMCITIRTIVIKENKLFVQAGAGIVFDSVPEKEYQETLNKARALLEAVGRVQNSGGDGI